MIYPIYWSKRITGVPSLQAYIYIAPRAPDDAVRQLTGFANVTELSQSPGQIILPHLDTPLSKATNALLDSVRARHSSYMRLRVVVQKGPCEREFANSIVEDKTEGALSYVEFLCHVHKQIQDMDPDR